MQNDPDDDLDDEEDDIVIVRHDDWYEDGCIFPGECCMPGEHLKSECHTAEMLDMQHEREFCDRNHPGFGVLP